MTVTIFRTINGKVVPLNVSNVIDSFPRSKTSRLPKFESSHLSMEYFKNVDSFTIPNAQCPVCGALVFFYEHVNGSKVYFEELGPPWTKHPCTDNPRFLSKAPTLVSKNEAKLIFQKAEPTPSGWEKEGWKPSKVKSTKDVAAGIGIPKSLEVTLEVTGEEKLIKCTFKHSNMKKLGLNKHSLEKALFQSRIIADDKASISVHSGITAIELPGIVLPHRTTRPTLNLHQIKLTDIQIQLPNPDGNLTLIFATMQSKEIMLVLDMNNRNHSETLEKILTTQPLRLTISSQYRNPRWGTIVTLMLNNEGTFETKLRSSSEKNKFLSTSQKAERISERKQRYGGNSSVADAFAKALKGT